MTAPQKPRPNPDGYKIGPGRPPREHQFKKGNRANPGGRPKGQSITARVRRVLEQEHNGKALMDLLAERLVKEALAGKFAFVKEVLERIDGRVTEKHEVTMDSAKALAQMPREEKEALIRGAGLGHLLPPTPPPGPCADERAAP